MLTIECFYSKYSMYIKMRLWKYLIFILFALCNSNSVVKEDNVSSTYPLIWSQFKNNSWVCGSSIHGAVLCTDDSNYIEIARCYCMFYDEKTNISQLGTCMATCFHPQFASYFRLERYRVANANLFNERMCVESSSSFNYTTNRTGRFCGRCQDGHGLTVYSYQLTICIPCDSYSHINWLKYFAMALVPLTVLYVLVVMIKINVPSSYLNGVVTSSQIMVSPLNLHILEGWLYSNAVSGTPSSMNFFISCFGVLNLDFFRDVYSPFCLNPKFTALQVIALDYIPALYPFVLIFVTYLLIKMHDKNFALIVWTWKPFKYLLNRYYKHLNVHTSLVETFASFILLSSVKIASISMMLLATTNAYDVYGKHLPSQYLYMDSTIEWFGDEHLPYGLLAMVTGVMFVFLPLISLLLYPCRCFQKFLNYFHLNFHVLRVFMDAFQGSYRTEPYDLRYFSAYYLFLRFFILFITATVQSIFAFGITTICLVINCAFVSAIQPHRNPTHNKIDILAMNMLAFCYISTLMMLSTFYLDMHWTVPANAAFVISQFLISSCFLGMIGWTLLGDKIMSYYHKLKKCWRKSEEVSIEVFQREEVLEVLSDKSVLIKSGKQAKIYSN